jgi:small-conductance mechanosensitive channel
MMVRPGFEDEVREQQAAHYQSQDIPGQRPKEAAGLASNTVTAAEVLNAVGETEEPAGFRDKDGNPMSPVEAHIQGATARLDAEESTSVEVVNQTNELAQLQEQIDGCAEMLTDLRAVLLAIAEQLPKTKRAKIQQEIQSLK